MVRIVIALIGCLGITLAAVIGLANPVVQKLVNPTSVVIVVIATPPSAVPPTEIVVRPALQSTGLPTNTPNQDCWTKLWSFNPADQSGVALNLKPARKGFSATFDTNIFVDRPGSLRVQTTKTNVDWTRDPDAWSWMENLQRIEAKNFRYRVIARIKTQNTRRSHISILGRDIAGQDVINGGTNQIASVPPIALDDTHDWQLYSSVEFNPKEWDPRIEILVIALNAGWSPNIQPSITWFDDVQLQYCSK